METGESSPRSDQATGARETAPVAAAFSKPRRVLACDRCHRRKIKCNRNFPCSNCIAAKSQCAQATSRGARSRRQPHERELLERLRHHENLLHQHGISPETGSLRRNSVLSPRSSISRISPLAFTEVPSPRRDAENAESALSGYNKHTPRLSDKLNIWHTASPDAESNAVTHDNENGEQQFSRGNFTHDGTMQKVLNRAHQDKKDYLLHFAPIPDLNISSLHPGLIQQFKVWQIYQDNVDPLLKVTHIPTLQASIINAVSNIDRVDPTLEALMFSVYCVSIMTLTEHDCSAIHGWDTTRAELLTRYQTGCQQALLRCGYLRSDDRNCLTALFLYAISIKPDVDRRSLCAMLGSVIRIAQRMGIHNEATNTKHTPFEAEMRRRLWWSIVAFDTRVCEMSNNLQSAILINIWDCNPPSNVNDSELRIEMKHPPPASDMPTQAIYIIVRSVIDQYLRHNDFQLAYINPALSGYTRNKTKGDELECLERRLEAKYFEHCDLENPVHYIALWTARSQLARARLLRHHWMASKQQGCVEIHTSYALSIISAESSLFTSSLTKNFSWAISRFYFPAYIHVLRSLQSHPVQDNAEMAWRALSDDFRARFGSKELDIRGNPVFVMLANLVTQAWVARRQAIASKHSPHAEGDGEMLDVPLIVSDIAQFTGEPAVHDLDMLLPDSGMGSSLDEFLSMPMDFDSDNLLMGLEPQSMMHNWDQVPRRGSFSEI